MESLRHHQQQESITEMGRQGSAEPVQKGSCKNVLAELLPLVLMLDGPDSKEERKKAIAKVLEGVNYVTDGNGNVSVEFNDNSKFFCGKDGNKLELQPPVPTRPY